MVALSQRQQDQQHAAQLAELLEVCDDCLVQAVRKFTALADRGIEQGNFCPAFYVDGVQALSLTRVTRIWRLPPNWHGLDATQAGEELAGYARVLKRDQIAPRFTLLATAAWVAGGDSADYEAIRQHPEKQLALCAVCSSLDGRLGGSMRLARLEGENVQVRKGVAWSEPLIGPQRGPSFGQPLMAAFWRAILAGRGIVDSPW